MKTDIKKEFITNYLTPGENFSLLKLKGDASERMYYRVLFNDQTPSKILMVCPETQSAQTEENYIHICTHLKKHNINVPTIYEYNKENRQMVIEDFGNEQLFDVVKSKNEPTIIALYKQAIDQLIIMQTAASVQDSSCPAFHLSFNTEKLLWELNFFLTHVQKIKGAIRKNDLYFFQKQFTEICHTLSREKRVFTHRDYHSKNLMIQDNQVKIIDFQDARLGPCQYDLVSLLKDAYANLSKEIVVRLLDYYLEKRHLFKKAENNKADHFFYIFDLMTFQRSLKACGSFCYLSAEKNKKDYMQYFPIAFSYAQNSLLNKRHYSQLLEKLSFYFDKK